MVNKDHTAGQPTENSEQTETDSLKSFSVGPSRPIGNRRRAGLADRTFDELKRAIIDCTLEPGAIIFENELAQQLGVSRTPVREALRRLLQEGWVRVVHGVGYFVEPITVKDITDVLQVRSILEAEAVRLATERLTAKKSQELAALADAIDRLEVHDSKEHEEYLALNRNFHLAVAEASGNRQLVHVLGNVLDVAERIIHFYLDHGASARRRDHHALLAAMKDGDGENARALMIAQLQEVERLALQSALGKLSGPTRQ